MKRTWLLAAAAWAMAAASSNARAGESDIDPYVILSEMLRSGQAPLEAYAAESFLSIRRAPPRDDLVRLADSRDARVRMTAAAVLGTSRQATYLPVYRKCLRDESPVVRLSGAFGLAMAGDPSAINSLRDALSSADVTERRTACWLLGLMGNPSAVGLLKIKLADQDAVVALRAAEALDRLGSDLGLEPVRRLTEHSSHQVRTLATVLLGRIGTVADIPRLERLSDSRKFLDVKFAALASLARQGEFRRIGLLVDMLEGPRDTERALAARMLGDTGYTPALGPLTRLLDAACPEVRLSAAAAILKIESSPEPWRKHALKEAPEASGGD